MSSVPAVRESVLTVMLSVLFSASVFPEELRTASKVNGLLLLAMQVAGVLVHVHSEGVVQLPFWPEGAGGAHVAVTSALVASRITLLEPYRICHTSVRPPLVKPVVSIACVFENWPV